MTRRALAVPATLACLALTQVAAADTDPPTKEACVEAHASGQLLRHEGKWLKARQQFLTCVADSCPAVLRRECSPWLLDLEARTPTLLVVAKDENGQTLRDATVTIDGDAAAATIAITSVPVDPGEHVIRITASFAPALEKRIVLPRRRTKCAARRGHSFSSKGRAVSGDGSLFRAANGASS
ncbi:MAG: hypothetical protein IPG50_00075 [Myxococcales bacterium]|nr:hypothetical protein [Myxococcales bacterium]